MIELLFPIMIAILFHFFVATLLWLGDIWEREPFREVVARIIWGGIPAMILLVIISIFFNPRPSTAEIITSAAMEEIA